MKTFFNKKLGKKIVSSLILFSISFSFLFSTLPQKTNAQIATIDAGNIAQSTITAVSTSASAVSQYSLALKEYVLDGLVTMLVKQVIRQITNSVVNWINSGFEGSPSFITNPGNFFLDVADQITGDFIQKAGGPLQSLCSPFSIDIRIALAFKYRPNTQRKYSCTLGTIIGNSQTAIQNASINGFTAGDFRQGGWPAFVSLTTEPQNNIYGAYLTAQSELSWKVAQAQAQQKDEISNGKGFLSFRDPKCTSEVKAHNAKIKVTEATDNSADGYNSDISNIPGGESGGEAVTGLRNKNDCPVTTPGALIVSSLEENVNGPMHELQLADEFNEIINALFAQLVTQILTKGLGSVSSKGPNGSSYLDQTISEINAESNPQLINTRTELLKNAEVYRKNADDNKKNREEAFNVMLGAKQAYEAAKACYQAKVDSSSTSNSKKSEARSKISEIDSIISTDISPKLTDLFVLMQDADADLKAMQSIITEANSAKNLYEITIPSQRYATMLQAKDVITAIDIQASANDLNTASGIATGLRQDAQRKLQMCQIL